jgi:glycosyltransferase involved in cell wall biosynthesis
MPIKLTIFFTYGISLDIWKKKGLLNRELKIYEELIKKHDIQIQLLTYGNNSDYQWVKDFKGLTVLPVYSRINFSKLKIVRLLKSLLIPWKFRKELTNQNIFKTNQMFGSWVAVLSKLMFKKPLIVRCGYEIYNHYHKIQNKPFIIISLTWLMSLFAYKLANTIHVATKEDLNVVTKSFWVPASKIEVRPNWIDINNFKLLKNNNRSTKTVLFVGRLEKEKNIFMLLDALFKTGLHLDIVGEGSLKSKIQIYADNLAVYVLCSFYEGNPKTLLEAMACGCAVIGTDVPGIRSIISHKKNGLLIDNRPSSLKESILNILSDNKLRGTLTVNAIEYIKNNNSLEDAKTKEFNTYTECLK